MELTQSSPSVCVSVFHHSAWRKGSTFRNGHHFWIPYSTVVLCHRLPLHLFAITIVYSCQKWCLILKVSHERLSRSALCDLMVTSVHSPHLLYMKKGHQGLHSVTLWTVATCTRSDIDISGALGSNPSRCDCNSKTTECFLTYSLDSL